MGLWSFSDCPSDRRGRNHDPLESDGLRDAEAARPGSSGRRLPARAGRRAGSAGVAAPPIRVAGLAAVPLPARLTIPAAGQAPAAIPEYEPTACAVCEPSLVQPVHFPSRFRLRSATSSKLRLLMAYFFQSR